MIDTGNKETGDDGRRGELTKYYQVVVSTWHELNWVNY